MTGWIDVEEDLPDDEIEVLVHTADGEVSVGFRESNNWRYLCASKIKIPVLHWAHMPEPPEEDAK